MTGGISGAGRNLTVGGSGSTSIESPIQIGGGSLTKIGGGTLFLSGLNSYTGGTNVLGGMLVATTRSLGGAIRNDAIVVFDQFEDGVYAGAMNGTGALYKVGLGELRLTGANSYGGGTGLLGGTLRGNSTTLQGEILANASLVFDQAFDGTYAGNLFGAGTLTKLGAGTLRMTGLGGGFTGQIIMREGRLEMAGQLGGELTMHAGTMLGGTGIVSGVTLMGGATLAPGDSIGTLRVVNDVRFQTGSTYRVETHAGGSSDVTVAGGRLGAGGGTVQVVTGDAESYRPITRYGIFLAGAGVAAPFAGVAADATFLNPTLQYVGNEVHLTLRRTDVDFLRTGVRGSGAAVATVLNALVATADGPMATVVNDVHALDGDATIKSLQSMSGLHYQHVATGALAEARRFAQVSLGRLGQPISGGDAIASSIAVSGDRHPGWWFRALDSRTRLTGNDGDPDARMPSAGFAVGLDKRFGRSLTLGVSGARTTPYVVQEGFGDNTRARMLHVGAYARYRRGASRVDGAFVAGDSNLRTRREVTIGASLFTDAEYGGRTEAWRADYARVFGLGGLRLEGVAGIHVDRLSVDAVDERGAGVLTLVVPERTASIPRSVLGARGEMTFARGSGRAIHVEGRALWLHEVGARDGVAVRFAGDADTGGFDLASPRRSREGGLFGATVYGDSWGNLRVFADLTFEVGGQISSTMGSVGIGRRW